MEERKNQTAERNPQINDTSGWQDMSTENSSSERLSRATAYERAIGRINGLIIQMNREHKEALDDDSFEIVLSYLNLALPHCTAECDRAWKEVYENAEYTDSNLEKLNNAVMLQAAQDYETALCVDSPAQRETAKDIERFAKSGASHQFSGVDFVTVLSRIKGVVPEFQKFVREKGSDIVAETEWIKRKRRMTFQDSKYRCPLCGGGLYSSGRPAGNTYRIRCTGCSLEGWYHAKKSY